MELADCHAMMDRKFKKFTRGYDPKTGTMDGVQAEAEAMIAQALEMTDGSVRRSASREFAMC